MSIKKIAIDKNTFLLVYKLLYDALFLALFGFASVLVAESILPGLITSKISLLKIIITIVTILIPLLYLGKNLDITYREINIHKNKTLPIFVLFSFLLIGNSLLKFSLWENFVITLATLFVFFLLYELIFTAEAE
ncbi:MAG: hypothetical protein HGA36_04185 [Candidatus Moranbacteria bacterium]|nr:hypothetical protein [Candidatus Moranbacteria bacterium]